MSGADRLERLDHHRSHRSPHAGGPEVVVTRALDRRYGDTRGRQRRCEVAAQGQALQRVVHRSDAVEVAAHPARHQARLQRAHLVEMARVEVRLVRVLVPHGRHDRRLALAVQGRETGCGRMPAQAPVLAERGAFGVGERELGAQLPVARVAHGGQHREGVDPARHEDRHEHPIGCGGGRDPLLQRGQREPGGAVDGQREAGAAHQELAPVEPAPGRRGCLRVARPRKTFATVVGHQLVCMSGEVATSRRRAFWRDAK